MDLSNLSIFMPGAIGKHVFKIGVIPRQARAVKRRPNFVKIRIERAWNVRTNRIARQKHESVFYIGLVVACILVFSLGSFLVLSLATKRRKFVKLYTQVFF